MFVETIELRVRYAETDQMGFVYYGNYAMYYEVARVEALRKLGYTYKEMEEEGYLMPVLENHSRFIAPAKYDDLLTIEISLLSLPGVKSHFRYRFFRNTDELIHEGETLLTFIKKDGGKPCRPPAKLIEILSAYY
jgi:acyl-CoA thioester hydrolase